MSPFKIPARPPTTTKNIRFPIDLVEQVEQVLRGTDSTFSAFVVQAVRMMLQTIEAEQSADGEEPTATGASRR